jgi:hypothetical protein
MVAFFSQPGNIAAGKTAYRGRPFRRRRREISAKLGVRSRDGAGSGQEGPKDGKRNRGGKDIRKL